MAIDMSMIDISLTQSRQQFVVSPPPYLALPPPALDQVQSPLFSDLSQSSTCILSSPVSKRALFLSSDDDEYEPTKVKRRFVIKRGKLVETNTLVTDPWPDSSTANRGRWILRGFRGIEQVSPGYMMDPRLVRILSITQAKQQPSELVRRYPKVSCLKFPTAVERREFMEWLKAFEPQLHSLWIASLTVSSFVPWIEINNVSQFVLTHEITDEVKLPPIPQWYDKVHDSGSLILPCVSSRWVFQSYLPLLAKSHHSLSRLYLASFLKPFHAQDTAAVLAGGIVTHHLWLCSRGTRPDDADNDDDQSVTIKPAAMVLAPTLQTLWLDSFAASQFFLRDAHVPYDLETLFLCLAPFGRDPPSMEKALDKCITLFKRLRLNQVPTLFFKLMWPPLFDAEDDEWTVKCLYNLRQAFADTEETTTITFVPQRPLLNESDRVSFVQFVQKVFEYRRGIVCKTAPFIPHIGECMAEY